MLLQPLKKRAENRVRVYVDGVFDLFHYGHGNVFRQAKNLFENSELIVGINRDEDTVKNKGQNVMTQQERKELVESCKYVDSVVCDVEWYPSRKFIEDNRIDFVAHDSIPYKSNTSDDIYSDAKTYGKFIRTFRTPEISTSNIIQRVVRNREGYILALKKRGYTLDELKVSKGYYCMIKVKSIIRKVFSCKKKVQSSQHHAVDRGVIYKSEL